jgi:hypothetical protein
MGDTEIGGRLLGFNYDKRERLEGIYDVKFG